VPFGDYGGNDDAVVARLEFSMPTDAEQKLASIGKAVEAVKTSWESVTRFTKDYMEYMEELPQIEKKIKDLHQTQTEGLKASTEALAEASEAGDKLVSTPISTRTAGAGAGQPVIPSVDPAPTATHSHEHLTDEHRTKPEAHRHSFQESSPPPAHYHERPDSERPAPAQHHVPTSAPASPHVPDQAGSASPAPARPHIPVTPPAQHQPQAGPVAGPAPGVQGPTPIQQDDREATPPVFRPSSTPPPVHRPPAPIPVAEDRPPVPVAVTDQELPSPQRPIIPTVGSSVPPPSSSPQTTAEVLASRPTTGTPSVGPRPETQHPDIPRTEETRSESARDDRETLFRPPTLPTPPVPGKAPIPDTQTGSSSTVPSSAPPPPATHHSVRSTRPADGGTDDYPDSSRDDRRPGVPARHDLDSPRPEPARPHTPSTGAPSPAPGYDRIQTHDAAQPTQPTPTTGGPPPRIEPSQGGPAETRSGTQNIVIRSESVSIDSPQAHVRSDQSTVHPPSSVTESPSLTQGVSRSELVQTSRSPREGPAQPPMAPPTTPAGERRLQDMIAEREQVAQHGVPGQRVIGHIPMAGVSQPPPTHPTVTPSPPAAQARPSRAGQMGAPQPTSAADYREKLGGQLKGNPAEIFDRMRQRGMTDETEGEDGQRRHSIRLGDRSVPFEEFQNDPGLQDEALDSLGQQSAPQSDENAGPAARAMYAGGLLRNIGHTVRSGGDATEGVEKLGSMVSSIGRGGGAAAGVGAAIGGAARFMGPVGMGVAAVTGANALIQGGGQKYQELYNQGTLRGGGAMEGAKMEAGVAAMALNPFISNEQSRQVIMGALNTGAQGPAYDSITEFMKDNLTNLNVSVADSTKMLTTNVKEGGASVESLGIQLGTLKDAAKTGSQTFEQLKASFIERSGSLVEQGVGGTAAGKQAMEETMVGNRSLPGGAPNPLAGEFPGLAEQMSQSTAVQGQLRNQYAPPGTDPMMMPQILGDTGKSSEAYLGQMQKWVQQAKRGPQQNWPARLVRIAQAQGVQLSIDEAQRYIGSPLGTSPTGAQDMAREAKQDLATSAGNVTEDKGLGTSLTPGNLLSATGAALSSTFHSVFGTDQQVEQDEAAFESARGRYGNRALDKVTQQYGLGNTVVFDPEGKPHRVDQSDQTQMEGLQSGEWKVAGASDPGQQEALAEDFEGAAAGMQGSAQTLTDAAVSGTTDSGEGGSGQFGLTPEASQLLKLIPGGSNQSDPNTLNSNHGAQGATRNNPAPGNAGSPSAFPVG